MRLVLFCLAVLSSNSDVLNGVSGWSIKLTCPNPFINGSVNDIILEVNSTKIDGANCSFATDVAFEFVPKDSSNVHLLGSSPYDPRPTCKDFTTPNTAGCVRHVGNIYTYKYTFPVDRTREGGRVKVSFCINPQGRYTEIVSDSCNSISFTFVGADVSLECPARFVDNKDYTITCTVNKAAVDGVTCLTTQRFIGFDLKRPTEPSPASQCSATYPCTSTAPVTATGACGCTKQEGDIFTYTYLFKAHKRTDDRGTLACRICEGSFPPLTRTSSESCKSFPVLKNVNSSTTDGDADSTSDGTADSPTYGDEEASSSSHLGLIMGATAGVVVIAMAIGTAAWCGKKRPSSGHNVQSNTRSDTPHLGTASPSTGRGLAATLDVTPREKAATLDVKPREKAAMLNVKPREEAATLDVKPREKAAGENASEASEASDVSQASEAPSEALSEAPSEAPEVAP